MSASRSEAVLEWPAAYAEPPAAARRDLERSAPRGDARSAPRFADCIPVRSLDRIVIVRVQAIVRLEADDNYVRIWADRMYLHKETLSGLCARLDPRDFLRVHRSHAVRIACVRELQPRLHGEYLLRLDNGVSLVSGRSYRMAIRGAFGLE
ncbi:MAG TPA: LytTR family DNA-binding domain-containing protein [Casimicrobiaceae bacterium]|nr:LytTR family DNA-binding domain-containing protein [Casimicrobiaceae bacterium]